jgi:integrase/recombinase XerD
MTDYQDIYDDKLPYVLNEFLGYLFTIRGKSPNTISGYKVDLKLFLKFTKKTKQKINNDNIEEIDIMDIDEDFLKTIRLGDLYSFVNYITLKRNNSNYARARKIAAIKSYFNYLETKMKIIKENPSRELESPKINKRHPVYLTLDQSKELLNVIDGRNKERDYAIISIFLNCGLRLSELVGINISKINEDTLTVIGKGNKERTVYLNSACIRAIQSYILIRPKTGILEGDKDALFLSERKKRIDKRTIELLVKKYILSTTGVFNTKFTPHKLRHTAATLMYKYGNVDIRALQEILGHESVSTTQIYTHLDEDKLRQAVNSNPLADEEQNLHK